MQRAQQRKTKQQTHVRRIAVPDDADGGAGALRDGGVCGLDGRGLKGVSRLLLFDGVIRHLGGESDCFASIVWETRADGATACAFSVLFQQ